MSEYYLADHKAAERARQREREREHEDRPQAQDVKITLLGDFMFPLSESQGFDPYNSTQGKTAGDVWRVRRDRR